MISKIKISNSNDQLKPQLEALGFKEIRTCYLDGGIGFEYYKKDAPDYKIMVCFLYAKTGQTEPLVFSEIRPVKIDFFRDRRPQLFRDTHPGCIEIKNNENKDRLPF